MKARSLAEEMDRRTNKTSGCWLWTGNINPAHGYARLGFQGQKLRPHRVAYELAKGPIPEGLVIDHMCRVRHCVNPDHLEAVTHRENTLRGVGATAQKARSATCGNGHPWTEANTVIQRGARLCTICRLDRSRKGYAAWRAKTPLVGIQLKDSCHRGHPLSGDNLYVSPKGNRNCRACARENMRRRRTGVAA